MSDRKGALGGIRGLPAYELLRESQSQTLDVQNGTANRWPVRDDVGGLHGVRSGFPNVDTEQRGKTQ